MKLSIIVPVYNAQPYLEKCLNSLVAQTLEDYEIILVNDGSSDGSQAIIDAYAERYPKLIRALAVENGGQGRARNIGMEHASGDYIGFVDSDDWVDMTMFEKLYTAAETERADITICGIAESLNGARGSLTIAQPGAARLSLAGSCCNKLFRRGLVGETRYPEGLWYEDFSFSAKLLVKAERLAFVNEALYFYRVGQESTMTNANARKNLDMLEILRDLQPGLERDELEYLVINHVLLDSINRVQQQRSPEKRAVIKALRGYVREQIPSLGACESYKKESRNRRIVMALNYRGLEDVSRLLLNLKKVI